MGTLKRAIGGWLIPRLPVNRRTFDILRFELGCIRQRIANACSPRYHMRIAWLRRQSGLSVNFGSGGKGLAGWINIDARPNHADICIAHDMRQPLPFRDDQVKRIFAEHVIEHVDFRDDIPRVLREFHRVLEPGGVVRIIVPDAERFMGAYVRKSAAEFADLGWNLDRLPADIHTPVHVVNLVFHQNGEHFFGWDFEIMRYALLEAGFASVLKQSFGVSLDAQLAIDQEQHRLYSLYVEAVK